MAGQPGTFEQLLSALATTFRPLRDHIDEGDILLLFGELGIEFPDALASDPAFANALTTIANAARNLPTLVGSLTASVDASNQGATLQADAGLVTTIRDLIVSFKTVAGAIDAQKGALPGLTPAEVSAFATALPKRLLEYLIVRQVEGLPSLSAGLDLAGVLERVDLQVGSVDPLRPPFTRRSLHLGAIADALKAPGDLLKTKFGWGAAGFDGRALLQKLERLALENGLPAVYTDVGVPTLDVMFLEIQPKTDIAPPGLRIRLHSTLKDASGFTAEGDLWSFTFKNEVDLPVGSVLVLRPDGTFDLTPPSGQLQGAVTASLSTKTPPGSPTFILIGAAGKSRLEFQRFTLDAGTTLLWDPGANSASGDYSVVAEVKAGQLVIDLAGADGFISEIVPAAKFSAQFDVGMGVSRNGVFFRGSSALEIQIPVHVNLAAVELQSVTVGVGLTPGGFPVSLGADLKASLGPLTAVVENVGMKATFAFADAHDGNLGPLDLKFGFKPPAGVGLTVDAGLVSGGGYLSFDTAKEEYAGVLELSVAGIVTVKAIGIINTRLPDGSRGFSLLIVVTAENLAIQLGFGFTLNGLGGILGLNRTMMLDRVAEGVRSGAIQSVMFPKDVIANAPRIISDLRAFFPPQKGVFLVGPMAQIAWGTPPLAKLSLAVVVEIPPANIAILGILKVALPDENAALLILQVNFIGALELDKQRAWFFASLFDSRVLFLTIEGEMGLLVAWGADANFVVSVGGFHPAFNPPPLPFPSPRRVAISLLSEPFARIRLDGYFAVTSNTAQFGAHLDLEFGLSAFGVEGHIGFDALFQFSPFLFIVDISASMSVNVFDVGVYSVHIRGQLKGPTPWHIEGEGSISLLFWDLDVPFSHTWGQTTDTTLPPIDVVPIVEAELDKIENWKATLPSTSRLLVSLRPIAASEGLVLHPLGALRVSQRAVPLDLTLDKVGNQKPRDVDRLSLAVTDAGLAKRGDAFERFATAQFKNLGEAEKLSAPAFERQRAGVELGVAGDQLRTDRAIRRIVRFETNIIDGNFKQFVSRFRPQLHAVFSHFFEGNAVAKSALSARTQAQQQPVDHRVTVQEATYVVASTKDNTAAAGATTFTSHAQATDDLRAQLAKDPKQAGALHVIPSTEVRTAA